MTLAASNPEAFAKSVVEKLEKAGFQAVFAGGCVRDFLMNRPSKDFDVATNALPEAVQKIFPRTAPVGEAFNVILVISEHEENPFHVEVATFRKDIGIADGRHPAQVTTATAQEDVERRDFTINGMLRNPITGEVFDWVGGKKDLEARIIRAIGNAELRIQEDHLRMLRAVRFATRFDFKIEDSLKSAIAKHAPLIRKISSERVFEEMTKMLTGPHADRAVQDLSDLGLLAEILPEALAMKGCEQPPEYHPEGDVWVHTLLLLKQCEGEEPSIGWSALLHDIAKPPTFSHEPPDRIRFNGHAELGAEMATQILKRMKAPGLLIEIVSEITRDHLKFKDVKQMRESTLKRFLRNPHFPLHLRLHKIDCLASHQNLELFDFCTQKLAELPAEVLKPPRLITGEDLKDFGLHPGPLFREILDAVETEQLETRLSSKEQALEFVRKNYLSN